MKSIMKKIFSFSLCAVLILSALTACGSSNDSSDSGSDDTEAQVANGNDTQDETEGTETPETVTVEHAFGTTEVPFSPERVCVLDSSGMDIMLALGLTDNVVSVQQPKGYPSYLSEYYTSDTIIKLEREGAGGYAGNKKNKGNKDGSSEGSSEGHGKGNSEESSAEEETEATDPYEVYYTIDADLIIGDVELVNEELYEILSQIAPTVVLGYTIDNEDGVYAGAKENARMLASIWGVEDELEAKLAEYDAIYEQLGEKLNGVNAIVLTSTSDSNVLGIAPNDGWADDTEKLEYERSVRILFDLGMNLYSNDAPQEVVDASVYERGEEADTRSAKNQVIAKWIEETAPEYLFIVDRNYKTLEEATADGFEFTDLVNLPVYTEGNTYLMSYDGRIGSNGLYGLFIEMDELKAIFLD